MGDTGIWYVAEDAIATQCIQVILMANNTLVPHLHTIIWNPGIEGIFAHVAFPQGLRKKRENVPFLKMSSLSYIHVDSGISKHKGCP